MSQLPEGLEGRDGLGTPAEALTSLRSHLRGDLITDADEAYDEARSVYNAMIDRRPAMIVQCDDVADVIAGVRFARARELPLAVRGGGHSGQGLGVVDDGLVLDLSNMDGVIVDPGTRTASVEGGATWGQVDHATHAFGLAVPSGILSTTGVGGLTLGGGHGYLTRKYGLTIDSLQAADMVLADGSFVRASEEDHPDLFWAIRGGGGNFGVVTSFLFRLHPVDTVVGGPMLWSLDRAREVMRWYREFILDAPEDVYGWFGLLSVPSGPPFPEELHGEKVCAIVWCLTGPVDEAERTLETVRQAFPPILDLVGAVPYPMLQSAFDGLYPKGHQWYWRADFVETLPDEAIDRHLEFAGILPSALSTMHLYPLNGAVHRVAPDATAFAFRDATWSSVIVGVDPEPGNAGTIERWCKEYWKALHPYSMGGAYVNFMMDEGPDRVRATYRGNHDRLASIKRRYDPDNVFRVNQNIRP